MSHLISLLKHAKHCEHAKRQRWKPDRDRVLRGDVLLHEHERTVSNVPTNITFTQLFNQPRNSVISLFPSFKSSGDQKGDAQVVRLQYNEDDKLSKPVEMGFVVKCTSLGESRSSIAPAVSREHATCERATMQALRSPVIPRRWRIYRRGWFRLPPQLLCCLRIPEVMFMCVSRLRAQRAGSNVEDELRGFGGEAPALLCCCVALLLLLWLLLRLRLLRCRSSLAQNQWVCLQWEGEDREREKEREVWRGVGLFLYALTAT